MLQRRRQSHWTRPTVAVVLTGVLIALAGCTDTSPPPNNPDPAKATNFLISYTGAASRLSGLDPAETQEQLRDWARTGLASQLELDTARLRDAAYDTLPVRDQGFADLSKQSTGPGRALFDGNGVLHLLVPRDDPHKSRTIGLLLDQYRTDAGSDPRQVRLHHYEIHPDAQTIELAADEPVPASEVRAAHGYVTMRVDETTGLTDFLARARYLSWLEVRGSEVWAGGWNWPGVPAAALDHEDVSALQRGYLRPAAEGRPGFSLDPGPTETTGDVLAVLPSLSSELADRIVADNWAGSPFRSADDLAEIVINALLFNDPKPETLSSAGLPADRTQLWGLHELLSHQGTYGQARYDGLLEGTKVGMTLFYTDYVAKDWVNGVGSGVPTQAVGGFVPDPDAVTPWSHCPGPNDPLSESGRLWFGQNESGFAFDGNRVSVGTQATRLFARSDSDGGAEAEPSFGFGRGLRWWDQHYQAVADYEPQYQRLEQIMRWSGALDWLVSTTSAKLPQLDDAAIRSDLRFKDWYAQNNDLRERAPIAFVTPPSAKQEAVLAKPSKSSPDCGFQSISGGVSLGDINQRKGGHSFHADLPEPVRRAGLFDEGSTFNPATWLGRIKQVSIDGAGKVVDSLERTFSRTADGQAAIDVVASGRRVALFGGLKVWRAETASRQLRVELTADRGQVSQRVHFQGQELGDLVTRKGADNLVTVQWHRGPMDWVRHVFVESVQSRLVSQPAAGLPPVKEGVLYSFQDASGQILYRVGGQEARWLSISDELKPPGDDLVFRLGAPNPQNGPPRFFFGRLVPHPDLRSAQWVEVTPATADNPARIMPVADSPKKDTPTVTVTMPDGKTATLYKNGDHLLVPADDPILGTKGAAEGAALLRDYPRVDEAMRNAAQAKDGLLHGVPLSGYGVALAGADKVILVPSRHQWAERVLRAIGSNPSQQPPLIHIKGDRAVHVDPSKIVESGTPAQSMGLDEALRMAGMVDATVYLHESFRATLPLEEGAIIANALPRDVRVKVREAVLAVLPDAATAEALVTQPDIRVHQGAEWLRVNGSETRGTARTTPTASPTPGPSVSNTPAPAAGGRMVLACPDSNQALPGCGE